MFRVLSIDGGGIRGIIPACVLVELEALVQRPLHQVFDLVVGTSTGGLLALAIGAPQSCSPAVVLDLYTSKGPEIFGGSAVNIRRDPLKAMVTAIGGPTGGSAPWVKSLRQRLGIDKPTDPGNARYSPLVLESYLLQLFGDARLSESRTHLVVPSYDMAAREPMLFRSSEAGADNADPYFRDVGRATTAAPTFFPPHPMPGGRILVDGGVVANNPSMLGLLEAFRVAGPEELVVVLSLGTGSPGHPLAARASLEGLKTRPWPLVAADVVQTLFDADSQMAASILDGFSLSVPSRVKSIRLQTSLGSVSPAMDDASAAHIRQLIEVGTNLVSSSRAALTALAQLLRG
jgi:predicted acylesterase/phospholipase RssA